MEAVRVSRATIRIRLVRSRLILLHRVVGLPEPEKTHTNVHDFRGGIITVDALL